MSKETPHPPAVASITRLEHDLLGAVAVPADALYGAQTQRALLNFPVLAERSIGTYPHLIHGLLVVKTAAAQANRGAGFLDSRRADAIASGVTRILQDRLFDQFPVHRFHGGGGTSANMNANEVLANLAEESLGGTRGRYQMVHPNDHVNLHQSTNDVYPTACHIAVVAAWPELDDALGRLTEGFRAKGIEFREQRRIARTCLQDAVDITFDDLFGGYAAFFRRVRDRIGRQVESLHAVNLGGTIVGRRSDVPEQYLQAIIPALCDATGDPHYVHAESLFDAAQNPDDLVAVSAELDLLARGLVKIAKDLRLMGSGPEAGLQEIRLPAVQLGSSMMPGKINPVIPEFAIQLALQATGHHASCQAALDHGELDLNVWESLVVFNILDSMALLANAVATLDEKCVRGLTIDAARNTRHADTIIPLLTRMSQRYSYSTITGLVKQADGDVERLRHLLEDQSSEGHGR